jgi:trk system potassium uptake protein TrkA
LPAAGSFTDPVILEKAGIAKADVVVAVTTEDENDLVISTIAKFEFAVPRVIARVNNPKNSWIFLPEMGVDVGLNQADLMAHMVAEEMSLGDMMTLMKLNKGQHSLVQEKVHPSSAVVGKALKDLNLPVECVIFAVFRNSVMTVPRGSTVLEAGDEILAVSHVSKIGVLEALLSSTE